MPQLLRDLSFGDDAARHHALGVLHGNIWHQGTVYEATAPAVPFLVEIATGRDTLPEHVRVSVLLLLLEIGRGSSYLAVHGPIVDPDLSEESRDQLKIELEWVAAVRRVVRDQLGKLLPLLDDDSPAVQAAVAGLAALFPDRSSSCVRQIEQLKAATSGPAAALYELVGVLLAQEPLPNDLLQRVAAADEEVADSLNYLRETDASLDEQVEHVVSCLAERAVVQTLDS